MAWRPPAGRIPPRVVYARRVSAKKQTDEHAALVEHDVDRAQIRDMLALTPRQRLERLESVLESIVTIRGLNARATTP